MGITIATCSCNKSEPVKYYSPNNLIVDSFTVSGFASGFQDLVQFSYLDDTTFYTLNEATQRLFLFHNSKSNPKLFRLRKIILLLLQPGDLTRVFQGKETGNQIRFYFGDIDKHEIKVIDEKGMLVSEHKMTHTFPYLKDSYNLLGYANQPLLLIGDTLIGGLINTGYSLAMLYKESIFNEFLYTKDTLRFLKSFGKFQGTNEYMFPNPNSCLLDNRIWLVFPFSDTLYQYNVKTGAEFKIPIHNNDFTQPAKLSWDKSGKSFAKLNQYAAHNFSYMGMEINQRDDHIVLFYNKPMIQKDKNKLLDPMASPLYAVVLDKKGTILKYYSFGSKNYSLSFFAVPDGIAIPKFSNHLFDAKTIHFDVFNF